MAEVQYTQEFLALQNREIRKRGIETATNDELLQLLVSGVEHWEDWSVEEEVAKRFHALEEDAWKYRELSK